MGYGLKLMKFQRDVKFVDKQFLILITKEIFMKYSLLAIAFIAFTATAILSGCGEPKPYNKPPSLYKDPESGERLGAEAGKK